jgi:hypothetical protein
VVEVGPAGCRYFEDLEHSIEDAVAFIFCHSRVVASGSYPEFDMDVLLRLEVLLYLPEETPSPDRPDKSVFSPLATR